MGGPARPERPGHVPDRAVGPGQQSALLGETAAVRPQPAVPHVVALDRRVPVRETPEPPARCSPRDRPPPRAPPRSRPAGPRRTARSPRVDREEVPFPQQQREGFRPTGVSPRGATATAPEVPLEFGDRRGHAGRRRGAAAPRRRAGRGSASPSPSIAKSPSHSLSARSSQPPAPRGPPGARRGAEPGSRRCGAAPPPGAARSPRTAARGRSRRRPPRPCGLTGCRERSACGAPEPSWILRNPCPSARSIASAPRSPGGQRLDAGQQRLGVGQGVAEPILREVGQPLVVVVHTDERGVDGAVPVVRGEKVVQPGREGRRRARVGLSSPSRPAGA